MNTRNGFYHLLIILLVVVGAVLPADIAGAAPEHRSLIYGEWYPQELIGVDDARVTVVGNVWRGTVETALFTATPTATPVAALVAAGSRFTATCREPSTTIGVQFLGDHNDGWARIYVDARDAYWDIATQGEAMVNDAYVEIDNLPLGRHVIQVETTAAPDTVAVGHVTVVAFGCGPLTRADARNVAVHSLSPEGATTPVQTIFFPTIMS